VKVRGAAAAWLWPEAFEEVLVGVGRVELDQLDRAVVGQVAGQFAGEVSLAGPGRPVQDDLLALPEQVGDLYQFCLVRQQAFGEIESDRVDSYGPSPLPAGGRSVPGRPSAS
jgi:hypothetical protein